MFFHSKLFQILEIVKEWVVSNKKNRFQGQIERFHVTFHGEDPHHSSSISTRALWCNLNQIKTKSGLKYYLQSRLHTNGNIFGCGNISSLKSHVEHWDFQRLASPIIQSHLGSLNQAGQSTIYSDDLPSYKFWFSSWISQPFSIARKLNSENSRQFPVKDQLNQWICFTGTVENHGFSSLFLKQI